ncbi:hypothetical protein GQ53DRAFT_828810 [Thozetella sp. PMI_491]|nr:hypothetical protein GQ53DRAFT_828810 [Thozetella sp. PMI_491]
MRFFTIASLAAFAGAAVAMHSAQDVVQDLNEMTDLTRSFYEAVQGMDLNHPGSPIALTVGMNNLVNSFAMKAGNVTIPTNANFTDTASHLIQVASKQLGDALQDLTKGMVSAVGIPPTATSFLQTLGLNDLMELPNKILGSFLSSLVTLIGKFMSAISTGTDSSTQNAMNGAYKSMIANIANILSGLGSATTSVTAANLPVMPTLPFIATILSLPKLAIPSTLVTIKTPAVATPPVIAIPTVLPTVAIPPVITIPTVLPTVPALPKLPTLPAVHI